MNKNKKKMILVVCWGNIKRVLDAELYFYSKIFGCDFIEEVEPVLIERKFIKF